MNYMEDNTFSQWVISEAAFTCMANIYAASEIGHVELTKDKVRQMINNEDLDLQFNTTSLAAHFPIFKEKLGENIPMKVTGRFKDIKVLVGQYDTDMIFTYTLCIDFFKDEEGAEELLYDEIKMITSYNLKVESDIMYWHMVNNKIDVDKKFGEKKAPIRNTMDMSGNEYREFLSNAGFTLNELKKWLNDVVFIDGIMFPYALDEIYTSVAF